jgi:signal peptidase I
VIVAGGGAALLIGLAAVARRRFVLVTLNGGSMEPTYRHGDRLIARRVSRSGRYRRGDVIVVRQPSDAPRVPNDPGQLVKRIIAVPGDPIPSPITLSHARTSSCRVPERSYLLRGDNQTGSKGSSFAYLVPETDIVATVMARAGSRCQAIVGARYRVRLCEGVW